jgi:hypothetical protein
MSRVMRAWQICPTWSLALGAAAKCGSTMLAAFVGANKARRLNVPDARYGREDWSVIPGSYRRLLIVRHPVERFASLYANIQQRKREPANFYKQLEGLSPWDCFDKLLTLSPDLSYDFHFQPQYLVAGPREPELVRLEHFESWVAAELPSAFPPKRANESQPVEIDEKTAARVCNRYREDLNLWEKAHVVPREVLRAEGE